MPRDLPSGTVTFLFTDIEGSTKLLHSLGAEVYAGALAEHRRIVREAMTAHGGVEVDTQGDAFFIAFPTAPGAVAAAQAVRSRLDKGPIRLRMGIHTGTPHLTDEGYVGADVHRAARIAAAGHGGQILVSAATAQLVDATALRDLGLHRLKDLTAAERIFQADPDEHPRLKTLHQTNLPVPVTAFLGREAELAELSALLRRDDVRLVTLTGPGGTGKTRLALQAAADAADDFRDGVWWVPLAAVRDAGLVIEAVETVLGLDKEPATDPTAAFADRLRGKRMLLLLDNLEQLIPDVTPIVATIVEALPEGRVMATSRVPVRATAEHEYRVSGLASRRMPGVEHHAPAVSLFVDRAWAAGARVDLDDRSEALISRICDRLDGLPLAIQLAAARLRLFSLEQLDTRLATRLPVLVGGAWDLPERQRTMRSAIAWSHELMSPQLQHAFARLGAFHASFDLEAAETIIGAEPADQVTDVVAALLDHSLLSTVDVERLGRRYRMLGIVREFALEQLDAEPDAEGVRLSHANHVLSLARRWSPLLRRHDALHARDVLEASHADFVGALDHAMAAGQLHLAADLFLAAEEYWMESGRWSEGAAYGRALSAALHEPSPRTARVVHVAGTLAWSIGDMETATALWKQALALNRRLDDRDGMARGLNNLSMVADDAQDALDLLRESHRLQLESGEMTDPSVLVNIADAALAVGDGDEAVRVATEALRIAERLGDASRQAAALRVLAWHAFSAGDLDAAEQWYGRALDVGTTSGSASDRSVALAGLGFVAVRRNRPSAASMLRDALTDAESAPWLWYALQNTMVPAIELLLQQGDTDGAERLRMTLVHVLGRHPFERRAEQLLEMAGVADPRAKLWAASSAVDTVTDAQALRVTLDALKAPPR